MDNFLEILQEFKKNNFKYKKQLEISVFQDYKSRRYVCAGVCEHFLFLLLQNFNFSRIPRGKVSVARQNMGE